MHAQYWEALDWIASLRDTEVELPRSVVEFNLPRTAEFLRLLGTPQAAYPAVVIAGTNGKGSTAAMIESLLRATGLRTGLYTSPHLHSLRERIQINRQLISPQDLADMVTEMRPVVKRLPSVLGSLSAYEFLTALALTYFAHHQIDYAVLEIGLGGRFDAVNVVQADIAVITHISFDHTDILGHTLDSIAYEKAGIIKPGVMTVTVPQHATAATVLSNIARERDAPLFIAEPEGLRADTSATLEPYAFEADLKQLGLQGIVQQENARLAVATAMLLRRNGLNMAETAFTSGMTNVFWPARFELLQEQPLVIVDGAHNADAAHKLALSLYPYARERRLILVLGILADKDHEAITRPLVSAASTVILCPVKHRRSANVDLLKNALKPHLKGNVLVAGDPASAVTLALQLAHADDLVCVTGSLFMAATAREVLGHAVRE
ncbi:MAG: bifunctional folylpolyglutamate synthase/dihydrofolate synthase [Chloroflexaceae bacterium]|nr:bifunctional folylpolyglutamate synthase/dihydrofolate synthase [Chloroflexaceae bacterium]